MRAWVNGRLLEAADEPALTISDHGFTVGDGVFEAIKVVNAWVGHYDYNALDQNAVIGPHPEVANFLFANGFSGHGLQQAPAVGRGLAEWLAFGAYRSLDLAKLGYGRIAGRTAFSEQAII